ncbi:glycosyltransferase [Micromonospora mirobrigensis]|uniref:Trehalose synthase n=1 Tax=Micromonospora mirobrigensis TaxID=262898 RepID=A0A1C4ZBV7_9ACTN|nr:glycosyltransferase [Micromonospora mirobrigensis]SCF30419.1 trehalose synthase [Micromonospora mirobrigensis]
MRIAHVSYGTVYGGAPELIRADTRGFQDLGCTVSWFDIAPYFHEQPLADYLHDALHGVRPRVIPGGQTELRQRYANPDADLGPLAAKITADRPDVVVLHDPVGLVLAPALAGVAQLVWRSHIGDQAWNEWTISASQILRPALAHCASAVVHLPEYVWPEAPCPFLVSAPGIDVDSTKNRQLAPAETAQLASLLTTGLVEAGWGTDRAGRDSSERDRVFLDHGTGFLPSDTARYAVVVARWDPLKGHRLALDAFVAAAAVDPDLHLVFVGPNLHSSSRGVFHDVRNGILTAIGELPTALRQRAHLWSAVDISTDVHQAGVNLIRSRAALVMQPSLREGFGLSLTESMYRGRTSIATAVGGHRHQISPGVNGLSCAADAESLAGALTLALEQSPQLGGPARASVTERFTAQHSARRQLEHFQRAAG